VRSHGDSNDVIEGLDEAERGEGLSKDGDEGSDGSNLSRGSENGVDHVKLNVLVGSVSENVGSGGRLSDGDVGASQSIENDDLGSVSREGDEGLVREKGRGDWNGRERRGKRLDSIFAWKSSVWNPTYRCEFRFRGRKEGWKKRETREDELSNRDEFSLTSTKKNTH